MVTGQKDHVEDQPAGRALQDRVDVAVGVGTGVFGVLAVIGLTLLPAGTRTQAALILAACGMLALACVTGLGAWQSASRFAITAVATVVALSCLAALSVATEAAGERDTSAASASQPSHTVDNLPTGSTRSNPPGSPPATSASQEPSGTATSTTPGGPWPGEPTGAVFITGSPVLEPDGDGSLDIDANDVRADLYATEDFDLAAADDGLGGLNGAVSSPWTGERPPKLSDCRAITEDRWGTLIPVDRFESRSTFCLRTTEDRFGYLQTRGVTFWSRAQDVREFQLSFVLWKKPGDR